MAALSKRGNLSTPALEEGQRKANRTQTEHLALLLAARRRSATFSCWTTRARPAICWEEAQWPQVRRHLQDSALKVSFTKYKWIFITIDYMSTNQANQVIWTTKSNSSLPSPPWSAPKETRPRFASFRLSSRARPSGIVWRGHKDQFAMWTTSSKSKHLRIPTTSTSVENAQPVF